MLFSLTTHWNAARHTTGEAMIEEILDLGFEQVELGYDLRMDLVPGVQDMVRRKAVTVVSVHNFCPVPVAAPSGHPELFTFTDLDPRVREGAVHHTKKTIRFAADIGARCVVVHAGYVQSPRLSQQLLAVIQEQGPYSRAYEKTKMRLQLTREKRAERHLKLLRRGLDQLVPLLQETGVALALENLPVWESVPTEFEMESLCREYGRPIRYWHDIGHAQVRQNLGFINQERWLERLNPFLAGMHVHDADALASDHLMPPAGKVDFAALKRFAMMDIIRVIEPAPDAPREHILRGVEYLRGTWGSAGPAAGDEHRQD